MGKKVTSHLARGQCVCSQSFLRQDRTESVRLIIDRGAPQEMVLKAFDDDKKSDTSDWSKLESEQVTTVHTSSGHDFTFNRATTSKRRAVRDAGARTSDMGVLNMHDCLSTDVVTSNVSTARHQTQPSV